MYELDVTSSDSEFVDELCSAEIALIVDLKFLVHLQFPLDGVLVVGISELESIGGARVWNVLYEDDLIVVDIIFHEVEVIDSPSWFVLWHLFDESLEIIFRASFISSTAIT